MIKKISFLLFFVAILSACSVSVKEKEYNKGVNIIPAPEKVVLEDGAFVLHKNQQVFIENESLRALSQFFVDRINASTGYNLKVTSDIKAECSIILTLDSNFKGENEGYSLRVTNDKIEIKSATEAGLFYAFQTVLQLLPAEIQGDKVVGDVSWKIPCVEVTDNPRFAYRGVMIDVARHFISVEALKKQIDVMSQYKINRFHWHLTDNQGWRLQIKAYPKLTEIGAFRTDENGERYGGFYTQDDVREIVAYAKERFITVIPEIDIPAHSMCANVAYPELSCTGEVVDVRNIWGPDFLVFCPGKENMFNFLDTIITEMLDMFPSEYYHLGGDECPKDHWSKCADCQKRIRDEKLFKTAEYSAEERLQSYTMERVEKILASHGKKMIGWDEILQGGVTPSATVMSWQGEKGGILAATKGNNVIMSPQTAGLYVNHYQGDSKAEHICFGGYAPLEKVYSYDPVPEVLRENGKSRFVVGVQANLWTEYIYNDYMMEYALYPRVMALAEIAWSQKENKDFESFSSRLENTAVRLDMQGVDYHIPLPEQVKGSSEKVVFVDSVALSFTTTRKIDMVYSFSDSLLKNEALTYTEPMIVKESTTLYIASRLKSGKLSPIRKIIVEKQDFAPAVSVNGELKEGLDVKLVKGHFKTSEELAENQKWESFSIKELSDLTKNTRDPKSLRVNNLFSAIMTGYVKIPEDGVYYFSTNNTEFWIDETLLINNSNEVKRYSRRDSSVALKAGLHKIKVVFLGDFIGGWPSYWDFCNVEYRLDSQDKFKNIDSKMLFR